MEDEFLSSKSESSVPNRLECTVCKKQFWMTSKYLDHMHSHKHLILSCNICNKSYYNQKLLDQHYLIHKEVIKTYDCKKCPRKFLQSYQLEQHLQFHFSNELSLAELKEIKAKSVNVLDSKKVFVGKSDDSSNENNQENEGNDFKEGEDNVPEGKKVHRKKKVIVTVGEELPGLEDENHLEDEDFSTEVKMSRFGRALKRATKFTASEKYKKHKDDKKSEEEENKTVEHAVSSSKTEISDFNLVQNLGNKVKSSFSNKSNIEKKAGTKESKMVEKAVSSHETKKSDDNLFQSSENNFKTLDKESFSPTTEEDTSTKESRTSNANFTKNNVISEVKNAETYSYNEEDIFNFRDVSEEFLSNSTTENSSSRETSEEEFMSLTDDDDIDHNHLDDEDYVPELKKCRRGRAVKQTKNPNYKKELGDKEKKTSEALKRSPRLRKKVTSIEKPPTDDDDFNDFSKDEDFAPVVKKADIGKKQSNSFESEDISDKESSRDDDSILKKSRAGSTRKKPKKHESFSSDEDYIPNKSHLGINKHKANVTLTNKKTDKKKSSSKLKNKISFPIIKPPIQMKKSATVKRGIYSLSPVERAKLLRKPPMDNISIPPYQLKQNINEGATKSIYSLSPLEKAKLLRKPSTDSIGIPPYQSKVNNEEKNKLSLQSDAITSSDLLSSNSPELPAVSNSCTPSAESPLTLINNPSEIVDSLSMVVKPSTASVIPLTTSINLSTPSVNPLTTSPKSNSVTAKIEPSSPSVQPFVVMKPLTPTIKPRVDKKFLYVGPEQNVEKVQRIIDEMKSLTESDKTRSENSIDISSIPKTKGILEKKVVNNILLVKVTPEYMKEIQQKKSSSGIFIDSIDISKSSMKPKSNQSSLGASILNPLTATTEKKNDKIETMSKPHKLSNINLPSNRAQTSTNTFGTIINNPIDNEIQHSDMHNVEIGTSIQENEITSNTSNSILNEKSTNSTLPIITEVYSNSEITSANLSSFIAENTLVQNDSAKSSNLHKTDIKESDSELNINHMSNESSSGNEVEFLSDFNATDSENETNDDRTNENSNSSLNKPIETAKSCDQNSVNENFDTGISKISGLNSNEQTVTGRTFLRNLLNKIHEKEESKNINLSLSKQTEIGKTNKTVKYTFENLSCNCNFEINKLNTSLNSNIDSFANSITESNENFALNKIKLNGQTNSEIIINSLLSEMLETVSKTVNPLLSTVEKTLDENFVIKSKVPSDSEIIIDSLLFEMCKKICDNEAGTNLITDAKSDICSIQEKRASEAQNIPKKICTSNGKLYEKKGNPSTNSNLSKTVIPEAFTDSTRIIPKSLAKIHSDSTCQNIQLLSPREAVYPKSSVESHNTSDMNNVVKKDERTFVRNSSLNTGNNIGGQNNFEGPSQPKQAVRINMPDGRNFLLVPLGSGVSEYQPNNHSGIPQLQNSISLAPVAKMDQLLIIPETSYCPVSLNDSVQMGKSPAIKSSSNILSSNNSVLLDENPVIKPPHCQISARKPVLCGIPSLNKNKSLESFSSKDPAQRGTKDKSVGPFPSKISMLQQAMTGSIVRPRNIFIQPKPSSSSCYFTEKTPYVNSPSCSNSNIITTFKENSVTKESICQQYVVDGNGNSLSKFAFKAEKPKTSIEGNCFDDEDGVSLIHISDVRSVNEDVQPKLKVTSKVLELYKIKLQEKERKKREKYEKKKKLKYMEKMQKISSSIQSTSTVLPDIQYSLPDIETRQSTSKKVGKKNKVPKVNRHKIQMNSDLIFSKNYDKSRNVNDLTHDSAAEPDVEIIKVKDQNLQSSSTDKLLEEEAINKAVQISLKFNETLGEGKYLEYLNELDSLISSFNIGKKCQFLFKALRFCRVKAQSYCVKERALSIHQKITKAIKG